MLSKESCYGIWYKGRPIKGNELSLALESSCINRKTIFRTSGFALSVIKRMNPHMIDLSQISIVKYDPVKEIFFKDLSK